MYSHESYTREKSRDMCIHCSLIRPMYASGIYVDKLYQRGRKKLQQIIPATENLGAFHISVPFSSTYNSNQNFSLFFVN